MRARLVLAALLGLVAPAFAGEAAGKGATPAAPIARPPTPLSDMMLDLQRLQALMAEGDRNAYDEQRARLKAVGAAIAASSPDAFRTSPERYAVVV